MAGVLLLVGFILRLRQYLLWRSLWLDEAMLALNLVNRDFPGLFHPLDYDQGAPIGFLLVEKFLLVVLGDNEFVLRLFPLLAGLLSLGLFYMLLKQTTSELGVFFGLALFALGPELIYYSSEVKQYSLDVAVAVFLILLAYPLFRGQDDRRRYFFLGLAGVLAMWFSHPALFVLAGIGMGLVYMTLRRRDHLRLTETVWLGGIWLANLALLYQISLNHLRNNSFLLDYWQENFMPSPSWSDPGWFLTVFSGLMRTEVGIGLPIWLVSALVILGLLAFMKDVSPLTVALISIFIFLLCASALRLYPMGGRLSLFLAPLFMLLAGKSLEVISKALPGKKWAGNAMAGLVGISLLYTPMVNSLEDFFNPKYYEHIRPAMAALAENWQDGNGLYVSYGALPAYQYYAKRYGLEDVAYVAEPAPDYQHPENLLAAFDSLVGRPRVWILMTHIYEREDFNEKDFLLAYLDSIGEKRREIRFPGTSVYLFLYDLGS